ncbi:hypothetical protein BOTBODRAFT_118944 [Botryobasidium botryosum FD-172 SS1]|uniref:AB hydrolase-1 domain-containing protein n=1 Tax=Botryobasidium botryosum (strain FD-172 SS1) TaxID=930990 RepID=A0A067M0Q3_BOTB1|nr:hypothetical protein BOTBODRAFT_118944 [Botryobasidium botryosum FD-172 SS1]
MSLQPLRLALRAHARGKSCLVAAGGSRRLQATVSSPSTPRPIPSFPCVDAHAARESRVSKQQQQPISDPNPSSTGPEPPYARPTPTSYNVYHHASPFPLTYAPASLPKFDIAYETWGTLSPNKDNVILLHTGLSASSHAASTSLNPAPGWWEKFIGPGRALDTNQFYIICTNVLGGCYGSTGPSSPDPTSPTGEPYATRFPIVSLFDMVRAQFCLLDYMGIDKLYASVGSSMGGMQSLAAAWIEPRRVGKVVSISGTARSSPGSVAMRFAQRSVLMADPNWNNGFYYDGSPPHTGMKLARQIATITYRSGPEWEQRFARNLSAEGQITSPRLCPDFLIETYLDHQGEQFCLKYDANSLIYISKAMDLFDMTAETLRALNLESAASTPNFTSTDPEQSGTNIKLRPLQMGTPSAHLDSLAKGLAPLRKTPFLILGVQSDILFPVEQQREMADALRIAGNNQVVYYELSGVWGHDTFLIDTANVGGAIRGFLS